MGQRRDPVERFWAFVDKKGPIMRGMRSRCWVWTGATAKGYGQFQLESRRTVRAHRFSYEFNVGEIPKGLTIDHLCRNKACIRPGHLEPCERGVNTLRGDTVTARNKAKKACSRGHRFTKANTIRRPSAPTKRECRTCAADRGRQRRLKEKQR